VLNPHLRLGRLEEGFDGGARGAGLLGIALKLRRLAGGALFRVVIEVAGDQQRSGLGLSRINSGGSLIRERIRGKSCPIASKAFREGMGRRVSAPL
jgi:hypothetical protein